MHWALVKRRLLKSDSPQGKVRFSFGQCLSAKLATGAGGICDSSYQKCSNYTLGERYKAQNLLL